MGGFGALVGFLLKSIWQAVNDLQVADKALVDKVASIEVLVAGNYVRRDDFDRMAAAIFAKLDRIEDKMGSKVDK
jgi:hypothetical protein